MSELNRFGTYRKISRGGQSYGEMAGQHRAAGRRLIGSPYRTLDPIAKWLLLGTTAFLILAVVWDYGLGAAPFLLVGAPVLLGVGVMIAAMGGTGWARGVAVTYGAFAAYGFCLV